MKDGKILGFILSVFNIVLIVICIFFLLRMDREAPKVEFQPNDLIYTSVMDEKRLLEGITAYDSRDGDITESIVIEKKIEKSEENKIIVFYAVSDKAGNITKASREFSARLYSENNDKMVNQIKEAGIEEALNIVVEQTISPTELSTVQPIATPEITPTPSATPTASPTETPTTEPDEEIEQQEEQIHQPEVVAPAQMPDGTPVFTLKVSEIKTPIGVRPALVDVIGKLTDDKDSYETLFHNIVISKYDINKAGSYHVTLTTEDSDGNVSATQPLTIIVE